MDLKNDIRWLQDRALAFEVAAANGKLIADLRGLAEICRRIASALDKIDFTEPRQ